MDARETSAWLQSKLDERKAVEDTDKPATTPKRPMTEQERSNLRRLARCRFRVGSYNKRFVHNLNGAPDDYEITEKQAANIERMMHRYRRQLAYID